MTGSDRQPADRQPPLGTEPGSAANIPADNRSDNHSPNHSPNHGLNNSVNHSDQDAAAVLAILVSLTAGRGADQRHDPMTAAPTRWHSRPDAGLLGAGPGAWWASGLPR